MSNRVVEEGFNPYSTAVSSAAPQSSQLDSKPELRAQVGSGSQAEPLPGSLRLEPPTLDPSQLGSNSHPGSQGSGKAHRLPRWLKRVIIFLITVFLLVIIVFASYVAYLELNYYRIKDHQPISIENVSSLWAGELLQKNRPYKAITYNIGFGAYTPDYTFFMDEGKMADGTPTRGYSGVAKSKASVEYTTKGAIDTTLKEKPNLVLIQEIDVNSDRSYHVNQRAAFEKAYKNYAGLWASDFHTPFLFYPIYQPHGRVNSGLLTLSDLSIRSAERRSYPIDMSFPSKYFDLDRCFQLIRMPVQGGKQLVLINSHMSAYDKGGKSRIKQLKLLRSVMTSEYKKGNYVICGGDWNHALFGSEKIFPSKQLQPDWLAVLKPGDLPPGFRAVAPDNLHEVASCRDDDIPYKKGRTFVSTVDGFFVSDNVSATTHVIDTGFAYSDHNPVRLNFMLK